MNRYLSIPAILAAAIAGCAAPARDSGADSGAADRVRTEAHAEEGVIEVVPLADGDVMALLDEARRAEDANQLDQARKSLLQAARLAPRDPRIWQHLAEIELETGEFALAIEHALKSFEIGPRVGSLCTRNWLTVAHAQRALDNGHLASAADEKAEACPVRARERL